MSKIYRIISTILIIAGLGFLGYYFMQQNFDSKLELFNKPSYYVVQNYWFIFLAGILVLLFSMLGSFFSWFKSIEEKEEILPNAGYSSKKEISTWIEGSSLDTTQQMKDASDHENASEEKEGQNETEKTELCEQTELLEEEKTELLEEEKTELLTEEKTEPLEEEKTELLEEEKTELLADVQEEKQ